jgi:hypothetical protein
MPDGDTDTAIGINPQEKMVSTFEEGNVFIALHCSKNVSADGNIFRKGEVETSASFFVLEEAIEIVISRIGELRPSVSEPVLWPPLITTVREGVSLVGSTNETDVGLEVWRERIGADVVPKVPTSFSKHCIK